MNSYWKTSKYNYFCKDEDGNYLMCNFMKGPESFLKVSKESIDSYNDIVLKNRVPADINNGIANILFQKGYLVDEDIDEELYVKTMYYNAIMRDFLSLTIMPTEQCNFRCTYCYEDYKKGKMSREHQNALLKYIQRTIMNTGRLHISWFGGEPLLALDVIEYIMENVKKMCLQRKIQFSSNMTTNGFFLDADAFDKLYKMKVTSYQITVDGMKEDHDRQRVNRNGSGTFDTIISNLISIRNLPQNSYKFAKITIRVNVTKNNLNQLDDFVQYYEKLFGRDRRFNIRFAITDNYGGERIHEIEDKLVSGKDIYAELQKDGIYKNKYIDFADALNAFQPMNLVCYAAYKNTFMIGSDLTVYRCSIHFGEKSNVLGEIQKNGKMLINENMNSKWYMKNKENPHCKECFYFPCCYNMACPLRDNIIGTDKKCPMEDYKKNLKNYLMFLNSKMNFETI